MDEKEKLFKTAVEIAALALVKDFEGLNGTVALTTVLRAAQYMSVSAPKELREDIKKMWDNAYELVITSYNEAHVEGK